MRPPERILVIMLRRIGDVILTTPAVRALRKLLPKAHIDFLVEPPSDQMLMDNPDLSTVLVYDGSLHWLWRLRRMRYDWVIDYMGNPRSALLTWASRAPVRAGPAHVAHRWAYTHLLCESPQPCYSALEKIRVLRALGLEPDESDFLPRWIPQESDRFAEEALQNLKAVAAFWVGLIPASRKITRRWPAASYAALGRLLRDQGGASILVFWGPGERELAQSVRDAIGAGAFLAPQTRGLRELSALLGRCRLVVTNCNGPKHIAVARGVPTLTLHGASDPVSWNPPGMDKHRVIRLEDLKCIGCRKNSCPYALECMEQLPPEQVFQKAKLLLLAGAAS